MAVDPKKDRATHSHNIDDTLVCSTKVAIHVKRVHKYPTILSRLEKAQLQQHNQRQKQNKSRIKNQSRKKSRTGKTEGSGAKFTDHRQDSRIFREMAERLYSSAIAD
jgi:hypothetical protein